MARANFVKAAQKTIYEKGKRVEYVSEKGKRAGQTLSKIDRTIPQDENDKVFIEKGESYYWWQFKGSSKQLSKTPPKASQLTPSAYLQQIYELEERISAAEASGADELSSLIDDIRSDIENLKEETEGSLDNMPEGLKSSPTGELLQERIDALDSAIFEIESIDCDYEEPRIEEWIEDECKEEKDDEGNEWQDDADNTELTEWREQKLADWIGEKLEELQSVSLQ